MVWRRNSLGPSRRLGPPGPWEGRAPSQRWGAGQVWKVPSQPLTPQALFRGPSLPCFQSSQLGPCSGDHPPSVQPQPLWWHKPARGWDSPARPAQGGDEVSGHRADVVSTACSLTEAGGGPGLSLAPGLAPGWPRAGPWGLSRCVSGPLGSRECRHCPGHGRRPGGVTAADPCGSCPPWEQRARRGSWRGSHSPALPRAHPLSFPPGLSVHGLPPLWALVCALSGARGQNVVTPVPSLSAPSPAQSPPAPA